MIVPAQRNQPAYYFLSSHQPQLISNHEEPTYSLSSLAQQPYVPIYSPSIPMLQRGAEMFPSHGHSFSVDNFQEVSPALHHRSACNNPTLDSSGVNSQQLLSTGSTRLPANHSYNGHSDQVPEDYRPVSVFQNTIPALQITGSPAPSCAAPVCAGKKTWRSSSVVDFWSNEHEFHCGTEENPLKWNLPNTFLPVGWYLRAFGIHVEGLPQPSDTDKEIM